MPTGRLKTWFAARGFGFIEDAAGGPDIFVHANALRLAGIDPDDLETGDHLVFVAVCRVRARDDMMAEYERVDMRTSPRAVGLNARVCYAGIV